MDLRRLRLLLELSRLGSMHEVAAELRTTTSSVSQGIAVLAREAGTPLVGPGGGRRPLAPGGARAGGPRAAIPGRRGRRAPRPRPRGGARRCAAGGGLRL